MRCHSAIIVYYHQLIVLNRNSYLKPLEHVTCQHGSQTQDQQNSIKTGSFNFMNESENATSDLLNIGRDQDVLAQGRLRFIIALYLALPGHAARGTHTLH